MMIGSFYLTLPRAPGRADGKIWVGVRTPDDHIEIIARHGAPEQHSLRPRLGQVIDHSNPVHAIPPVVSIHIIICGHHQAPPVIEIVLHDHQRPENRSVPGVAIVGRSAVVINPPGYLPSANCRSAWTPLGRNTAAP